jgi:glycosyltransferase involved in cell wall biosynthesis
VTVPTVAAIVPTFRRPRLLGRALASIHAQTRAPNQVIVVDDDPVDGDRVREVVAASGLATPSVVENSRGAGASGARNSGVQRATCDVLAFLDDDDEWLPAYLETALAIFEERSVNVVCVDFLRCDQWGNERDGKAAPERLDCDAFLTRNPGVVGSNILIRRLIYHEVDGFDESLPTHEDVDLGLRLSLHPAVVYRPLHRPLVRRHEHSGPRLSTAGSAAKRAGIRRFYELHSHRMNPNQRREFRARSLRLWGFDEQGRGHSAFRARRAGGSGGQTPSAPP